MAAATAARGWRRTVCGGLCDGNASRELGELSSGEAVGQACVGHDAGDFDAIVEIDGC